MSSGATVRRSITSTEMPSAASALGGGQRLVHHPRHRHDGDVGARPHDGGHADREDVVGRRLRALHAVEQPVLDEDDRVRVLDRGAEQAVGVGRRRRHDDAQAGDVGEQRLEALRVLAARRAPGAELGAHGQRHLGRPAGHERQLGRLVEQLVEADADEVEVHELDHRAHPGHGRADAEAHDRRLGDRRVADAVAEPVVQAPREPEDVAARADVDAGDEDPVVVGQLGLERVVDGVHGAEDRGVVGRGRRLGPRRSGPDDEVGAASSGAGAGEPPGRLDRLVELVRPPTPPARRSRRRRRRPAGARAAWTSSGSRSCHSAQLLGRSVALGVALVVAVPAVGRGLDDDRAAGRRGPRRPRRPSAAAVATTSLPSTAT